jgi:hypothetical protein
MANDRLSYVTLGDGTSQGVGTSQHQVRFSEVDDYGDSDGGSSSSGQPDRWN